MRLEVTRRTDLATRALIALAAGGGRRKASELAADLDASPGFLSQAMTPMVNRGWVRSEPGGRCALHDAWGQARGHLLRDLAETPLSAIAAPRRRR